MARTNHTGDIGRCMSPISPRPPRQHVNPLNGVAKLALDCAQATLDRYGEIVSEVYRRFALLAWRGKFHAADDGTSEPLAQPAIDTYLAHAAALAQAATKLQLEYEMILARCAPSSSHPAASSADRLHRPSDAAPSPHPRAKLRQR